jgi:hypothetical protein
MSWFDNLKKWFWGDLKPELQEEPSEKPKPKIPETTDEVLEEEVKKKTPRKRTAAKKPTKKKPAAKKPRKSKKKESGE